VLLLCVYYYFFVTDIGLQCYVFFLIVVYITFVWFNLATSFCLCTARI